MADHAPSGRREVARLEAWLLVVWLLNQTIEWHEREGPISTTLMAEEVLTSPRWNRRILRRRVSSRRAEKAQA